MNSKTIVALAALEQKLDTVLFARPDDDEESHTGRNLAIAGAGTAAAGGGLLADRRIMARHGQRQLLGTGEIKPGSPRSLLSRTAASGVTGGGTAAVGRAAAYRQAGRDLMQSASGIGRAARVAGKQAYRVTRDNGEGLAASLFRGVRKAGKVAISKARALDTGVDPRVLALAARADELIQFDMGDAAIRNLYGPIGVGLTSRKGKRLDAFKESYVEGLKGSTIGSLGGAGIGAGLGALVGKKGGRKLSAGIGALGGSMVGGLGGSIYGTNSKKAREIQARYK
jgi:hypothetical protein